MSHLQQKFAIFCKHLASPTALCPASYKHMLFLKVFVVSPTNILYLAQLFVLSLTNVCHLSQQFALFPKTVVSPTVTCFNSHKHLVSPQLLVLSPSNIFYSQKNLFLLFPANICYLPQLFVLSPTNILHFSQLFNRLVGLVVKASASRAEDPGFACDEIFRVESDQWLPCQATGDIGSALGLIGLVSVYCDWVKWKV